MKPNVSVIITTFNSAKLIAAAITSVLQQIDVAIEIIVVDDCSDDFQSLQDEIAMFHKEVSIVVRQPKQKSNANVSRNIAIKLAKFPYVAFLDADDTWNPKHLISSIQAIKSRELDACFSKVELIANGANEKSLVCYQEKTDICDFIFNQGGIAVTSCLVITKSTLHDVHFDNNLLKHQDWDFLIRYTSKYNLGQSPYYGLNYTLSTGMNMSSKYNFEASISFMNITLPARWHATFLSGQLSKILVKEEYEELLKLSMQVKNNYKNTTANLGLRNYCIIISAKHKIIFLALAFSFHKMRKIKHLLHSFLK